MFQELGRAFRTFRLIDDHGPAVEPFCTIVDHAPHEFVLVKYEFGDCIAWELCYTILVSEEEAETLIPAYSGVHQTDVRYFERADMGLSSGGFQTTRLRAFQELQHD